MSSSEEDISQFADCVYEVSNPINPSRPHHENRASNRYLPDEHKQFDYKNVKVTASFQKHVRKHLESLLDDSICVKVVKPVDVKKKKKSCLADTGGITLLSTSQTLLVLNDDQVTAGKQRQSVPKRKNEISEKELLKRAKQVAVASEHILSKKELEGWAPETRGKVEIIQMKR